MKDAVIAVMVFALSFVFVPAVVRAAAAPGQEAPSFTNRDLQKYEGPADSAAVPSAPAAVGTAERKKTAKRDGRKEKAYWCSRAGKYQKKIDKAKDELNDLEKGAADDGRSSNSGEYKMSKSSRRKYEQAKKKLREAQRDLSYLEEEAHRKDIPPGWLRCQFE